MLQNTQHREMSSLTKMELASIPQSKFCSTNKKVWTITNMMQFLFMHSYTDKHIVRKQFGILDELDNYSFTFVPGLGDDDIYPCEHNNYYDNLEIVIMLVFLILL